MKDLECVNKIEYLLNKSYYVIDFLPEQVPQDSKGQFFEVEKFYLSKGKLKELQDKFIDILLKLNCYYDFIVVVDEKVVINPKPSELIKFIYNKSNVNILIDGQVKNSYVKGANSKRNDNKNEANKLSLITINHGDTYMTVYNACKDLLNKIKLLAQANGLFVWKQKNKRS